MRNIGIAPASLIALGLIIASSVGGAVAADLITGKDIKNGTVTTKDIKNKTLKLKDMSSGAKQGLRGAAGPAGPAGPTGPAGPSAVFSTFNNSQTAVANMPKSVVSLALAPGNYWISSKAVGHATGPSAFVQCWVARLDDNFSGDGNDDFSTVTFPAIDAASTLTNQAVFSSATPLLVDLYCRGDAATVTHKKMTALKVGSVAVSEGPIVP